jgi:transposase
MESTASYWKPVYNLLELEGLHLLVVNAQHIKNVPGRKTDVKDAEWIAGLLRHGLLKGSFIPSREQRELRELIRYRRSFIDERAREINRIQKVLEGANIKLSSVASDVENGDKIPNRNG